MRIGKSGWDDYPKTPDSFRDTVRRAVQAQMQEREQEGSDAKRQEKEYQALAATKVGERKGTGRRGRGRRWRALCLAAALMAFGTVAMAAGSSLLHEYLEQRGYESEDIKTLIETEPVQQAEDREYTPGMAGAVMEKHWQEPVLKVTQACFTGTEVWMLMEASEEAGAYELYLKDHGSINGYDSAVMGFAKTEEPGIYFGRLQLASRADAEALGQPEQVTVEMQVVAEPKYEGSIWYIWEDEEAYRKRYPELAFAFDHKKIYDLTETPELEKQVEKMDGIRIYPLSGQEATAGYTPQKLTLNLKLDQEARETLEQYAALDQRQYLPVLEEPEGQSNLMEGEEQSEKAETLEYAEETKDTETLEATEMPESDADKTDGKKSKEAENREETKASRVSCILNGGEHSLNIDASVSKAEDVVYTGTVRASFCSPDLLQGLYSEELGEGWREQEEEYDLASWISQDGNGHVGMSFDSQFYENTESKKAETLPEPVSEEEGIKICREVLEKIGMEGSVYQAPYGEGSTYRIQPKLEGLPLAEASQWFSFGTVTLEGEKLAVAMLPLKLKTEKKEQAALLPMEEILERLGQYAELGEISFIEKDTVICEIRLEYYILLAEEGLVYRPVWNFRGPASWREGKQETEALENFLYMDAVTGAYISSLGSLQGHA